MAEGGSTPSGSPHLPERTEYGTPSHGATATSAGGEEGRSIVSDVVVVLGAFLVAGLAAGAVWPHLVDPVTVTRTDLGIGSDELALTHRFSNDAWYSFLGAAGGFVLGVALTLWRRTHEVVTLLLVVAGAFLAALVASRVGTWLGPEDPHIVLADADIGATAPDQIGVTADAAYLVWPIAAVVGAVIVLWGAPGGGPSHLPRILRRRVRRTDAESAG